MAEVIKKLGLPKPDGFLYFVESDGTVWKHKGGQKTVVSKAKVKREEGYLYFIDMNGDLHLDIVTSLKKIGTDSILLFSII